MSLRFLTRGNIATETKFVFLESGKVQKHFTVPKYDICCRSIVPCSSLALYILGSRSYSPLRFRHSGIVEMSHVAVYPAIMLTRA